MSKLSKGLITAHYINALKRIHGNQNRSNGFGGKVKPLGHFVSLMTDWQPATMLDYGCGKGAILAHLQSSYPNTVVEGYDPAVDEFNRIRKGTFDCVVSCDVLEHIEPTFLVNVLAHINTISNKFIWLRIDTVRARKTLPNGDNAHLIIEDQRWWTKKLNENIDGDIIYNVVSVKGKLDIAIQKKVIDKT